MQAATQHQQLQGKQPPAAAGRSASYTNTQPWEVAVVTGAKRDELQAVMALLRKDMTDLPLSFDNFRD